MIVNKKGFKGVLCFVGGEERKKDPQNKIRDSVM